MVNLGTTEFETAFTRRISSQGLLLSGISSWWFHLGGALKGVANYRLLPYRSALSCSFSTGGFGKNTSTPWNGGIPGTMSRKHSDMLPGERACVFCQIKLEYTLALGVMC